MHSSHSCLDKVVHTPIVCNDRCPDGSDAVAVRLNVVDALFCRCSSSGLGPCDHAETPFSWTVEVPQNQFIAWFGGHPSSYREGYSTFSIGCDDGFFDAFCVIFRAPPAVPELSASFSSFRALTTVSARGLQGVPESPGVLLPGDLAPGFANSSQRLLT